MRPVKKPGAVFLGELKRKKILLRFKDFQPVQFHGRPHW